MVLNTTASPNGFECNKHAYASNSERQDMSLLEEVDDDFFEGQEKTLEVWFKPIHTIEDDIKDVRHTGKALQTGDLRLLKEHEVVDILEHARCSILATHQNDHIVSYILSESSLFITANRIILKTCGKTTLLDALPVIQKYASSIGLVEIEEATYSRRELLRPHEQEGVHTSFDKEASYLLSTLDGGYSTSFGKENTINQWNLFTLNAPSRNHTCADATIEMLMSNIDEESLAIFFKNKYTAEEVTKLSKISNLVPAADVKAFLFDPCGYSCNAILGDAYFTIHVTPQQEFSFVSFETDIIMEDYTPLLLKVLKIFNPRNIVVNVIANFACAFKHAQNAFNVSTIKSEYSVGCVAKEVEELQNTSVAYYHFEKAAS